MMKNKLTYLGIIGLFAMTSCTVVYENPSYSSRPQTRIQQQVVPQNYNSAAEADTSIDPEDAEPLITFDNGYYDDSYVYNPYFYGSAFYAGNPFWGVGLYPGWGWGGYYSPFAWNFGIGYGWGGYYGWGSLYCGWGWNFGWPYYGWGWGGGYRPVFINNYNRYPRTFGLGGMRGNIAGVNGRSFGGRIANSNYNISSARAAARDFNLRGTTNSSRVTGYNRSSLSNGYNRSNSSSRSYTPNYNSNYRSSMPSTRSYTPQSSSRSYSQPSYSAPSRSYGGGSIGGGRSFGGGTSGGSRGGGGRGR